MNRDKGIKSYIFYLGLFLLYISGCLTLAGGIIWVALHFIRKFW